MESCKNCCNSHNRCGKSNGDNCEINKLSATVQKCIENLTQSADLKLFTVEVRDITTNGGNYFGSLKSVDIVGYNENDDKEINLFVKNIISAGDNFEYFSISEIYARESFIYNEVMMIYDKLQNEYKVPDKEKFNIIKSYEESNSEVILLENMTKKGFETCDRRDVVSLRFAEISIEQLSKFHALSFVLQQKRPKYFAQKIKSMKVVINFESNWQDFVKILYNKAVESLEVKAKGKLEDYYTVFLKKYEEYFKISDGHEDAICLCHGDYRPNNILMKQNNGEVTEVCVIDYQFASYTSPVLDLLYFIFLGTDQKFRDAHMEDLIKLYYDTFERYLKYFGIEACSAYSRERFESEFREKLDFGLLAFIILMPFTFAADNKLPEISGIVDLESFSLDVTHKKRVQEVVDFFIKEGYL